MPFVELLSAYHDRKSFDCGSIPLNTFLQRQARQNADRHLGVTRVVVAERGDTKILGYYTLVISTVESEIIPDKKLPTGKVGVVLLGRLATDLSAQGRGLGRQMLLRAMYETLQVAQNVGVYALTLDAIDDAARAWYVSLGTGLASFLDSPNHLYVQLSYLQLLKQPVLDDTL